ncbi:MAG: PKD domain-containing protein [Flavipsychrobacter sp.]|nr:PKD domain-containing protein [Flavipsychrobacter sp.]
MDLFYTHVSGNTYKITLVAYGDCGSAGSSTSFSVLPTNTPEVHIYNGGTLISTINLAIQPPTAGVEITPVCPAFLSMTQCTSLTFPTPGIKKFVYSANYTLPGASPVWRFIFTGQLVGSIAGRALSISNISTTPVSYIQLVDTLNNTVSPNSSPALTNVPTPFFCLSAANNYNPGAVDPNGDSLRFALVNGAAGTTTSVPGGSATYIAPYTGAAPLAVSSMSFDQQTGQISFTPSALQRSLVVYNIREYRGGVFVGSCQREMTFLVQACADAPPNGNFSGATAGTIVDNTHFNVCKGVGTYNINIFPYQTDTTNNIFVTTSGLPSGMTFTTTGNGTPHPTCLISWTTTGVAPGAYTFYVTYTDNNCPLSGTQTIAYTITVLPQPTITTTLLSAATCDKKAAVTVAPGGTGAPWTVKVSRSVAPFDTIQTYTGVSSAFVDSLVPGGYTYTIFTTGVGCRSSASLTLAPPSFPTPTLTGTNPTYCGNNNGSIRLSGLLPGTIDTVKYTRNAVAQTPIVTTVASDGTITITGLTAAVYANFIVSSGRYCRTPAVGPITLVNPPFFMRAIDKTDPPYCGVCTGVIRLYGLQPGQTDTITYYRSSVLQPPVVAFIGPDSMVTITGLCSGFYHNFVARTAGVCVSNTLGPVTLAVPPFTARATSHTNPPFCGMCTGTLTIYGLHPGMTDTVTYLKDGVAQPPVVRTIGADSTAVLTGLCAGIYSNIVVRTGGVCVSNVLGPDTLTAAPLNIRALTFTNPPYCGICTGTVTLYGLFPGQTDTVNYTKGGVPQPPKIQLVGPDSTITITGLCAGLYDNFVARTGGVCVSNSVGPANLTVPPFTMRAISKVDPDYCGICNGVIRLYGLYPGQTDTVNYTKDGVPQPPKIQLVGPDSIITITGLCAGVYDNFVARTGGVCVSNTLGPVTLSVPPFTMRALSFTNPPYCGICTGTITLYGLHPGMTDTVSYTKDGVPQPPKIQFVGPDSTITITGLCAGLYDNFIARTGGVCVSNTLGPANLTVPPFTMSSLTFTNPLYCGICTGTVTLRGLYPGQTDTVTFTKDGAPFPAVVQTVAPDSTITITGLCAGLYDNFVARTGGVCVSNTLGPANLTVPPFTMRAITFANATKCGWCDGKIRLLGLHPGQTDTITYKRNGVVQPPVIATIGADSTVYINGLCDGVYSDFVARTGGVCVSNVLGPVTLVDPPITPGYNFVVRENCKADTVLFTNTSTPAADLTYTWTFGDGSVSTVTNPQHIYTLPGNYDVTLVITNTRCVDSISKKIAITNIVKAGFTNVPDSFVCTGVPVTFTNTSLGFQLKYAWTFGDGKTDTVADPVHVYNRTGTYKIVMALSNNVPCRDTARAVMTVDSISDVSIKLTDSVLCDGKVVTFTGIYADIGSTGIRWSFGDGSQIANQNPVTHGFDGEGSLTVRFDAFYRACPDTFATKKIWVFSHPQTYLGGDTTICPGSNPITLTDGRYDGVPGLRWLWSTGEKTNSIKVTTPGSYWAKVIVDGCTATDTIEVKQDCYLDVPNAFTPNGDGINDYFLPRPLLARGLATFKLNIYNRWGQLIFETEKIEGRGWDGRLNGVDQPEGVYVYTIDATFIDGQIEKRQGNITLIR